MGWRYSRHLRDSELRTRAAQGEEVYSGAVEKGSCVHVGGYYDGYRSGCG